MIGAAWIIGADVHVESLDDKYVEGLNQIKHVMKKWYPKLPFTSQLVTETVSNSCPAERFGLVFSGGLDSVTSYIKHIDKNLTLITVSGRGERISSYNRKELDSFLPKQTTHNLIETNVEQVLNLQYIDQKFCLNWWINIAHGIVLTSLCAPITCAEGIGTLFISSSFAVESNFVWGSHPLVDNKIRWANTKVVHDSFELNRQKKSGLF